MKERDPQARINRAQIAARLEKLLHGLVAKRNIKQAVVAVESGDGALSWRGAAGDGEAGVPIAANMPVFAASVTKMYTAAVVLRLHEQGQINIEASAAHYLPPALLHGLHHFRGTDYTSSITVRHLLNNTSGLPCYFVDRPKGGNSLAHRLFSEGDVAWTMDDMASDVRERLKPHFPPQNDGGKRPKVRYSNTNYELLGAIIETVAGKPFHRVLHERLFQPLQLGQTYVFGQSDPVDPMPPPAPLWFNSQTLHRPRALASLSASGGLVFTVDDALKFMRALMGGAVFSDPEMLAMMMQSRHRFGFPLDPVAATLPGWPIEYGLGIMQFRLPRIVSPTYRMPEVFGHTGSTGSWLFYCPRLDVYMVGTVNEVTAGAVPYRFIPKLLQALEA